ncbi:hypothetical protein HYH03_015864 [Edaphochlamys debaryana]|uniref:F-box domain-containing protein n=1 Tax=Edaphochlamys debaryana TaxID=47281 RepID=A0A835XJR2_9CHLO|nr:hypothetical protein HYH03_015864 [Edaphochlamys debaryana]|eukprot:KAG2485373.1 hypothetical protein HYH03_015864 [Edaphochlamys debaryana]
MADTSQQLGCAASCSFGDVLRILPSAARATLWQELKSSSCVKSARSSCRALRELVDGQTSSVGIPLKDLSPAELVAAFHEGLWLVRRPNCTQVTLFSGPDASALLVPFATAPAAFCRAITELSVYCDEWDNPIPGGVLLGLTSRLPGLTSLELSSPPPAPDCALERQLASYALSLLPNVANLTLNDCHYVPLLPASLAARLTQLSVFAHEMLETRPTAAELATVLSKMTALRELHVSVAWQCPFGPEDVRQLLDAVPRTSLRTLEVHSVGEESNQLCCTYAGGFLDTVEITNEISPDLPYTVLSSILGTAVRRSSAMGPRLRLLKIGFVEADGIPDPDPAAELYTRCGSIELGDLIGGEDMDTILSLVERLGVPERLRWNVGIDDYYEVVRLKGQRPSEPAGVGPSSGSAGSRGGGQGSSGRALPAARVLSLPAVIERAVERMVKPTTGPGGDLVVLRGPLVRSLIAAPRALQGWLQEVSASAAATLGLSEAIVTVRMLPSAGTVLAQAAMAAGAGAVAEAARLLGGAAPEGGTGVAMVEATHSGLRWRTAVVQVLQALWDGEAEGDSGGAAGQAAPGGPSSEVERLRCLVETWQGLRDMPKAVGLPAA